MEMLNFDYHDRNLFLQAVRDIIIVFCLRLILELSQRVLKNEIKTKTSRIISAFFYELPSNNGVLSLKELTIITMSPIILSAS